jgi:hypothetical protein
MKRWKAIIEYRTDAGPVDVEHEIQELDELQELVERGPDWRTMNRCTVTLARNADWNLTVEQAGKL